MEDVIEFVSVMVLTFLIGVLVLCVWCIGTRGPESDDSPDELR